MLTYLKKALLLAAILVMPLNLASSAMDEEVKDSDPSSSIAIPFQEEADLTTDDKENLLNTDQRTPSLTVAAEQQDAWTLSTSLSRAKKAMCLKLANGFAFVAEWRRPIFILGAVAIGGVFVVDNYSSKTASCGGCCCSCTGYPYSEGCVANYQVCQDSICTPHKFGTAICTTSGCGR